MYGNMDGKLLIYNPENSQLIFNGVFFLTFFFFFKIHGLEEVALPGERRYYIYYKCTTICHCVKKV